MRGAARALLVLALASGCADRPVTDAPSVSASCVAYVDAMGACAQERGSRGASAAPASLIAMRERLAAVPESDIAAQDVLCRVRLADLHRSCR